MHHLRVDSQVAAELNRSTVFELLRTRQVVSRVSLARETGLSKATISQIIDQFLKDGFVHTVGPGESEKGRRPTLLRFDPRSRLAIGLEIGDTGCQAILTDLNATPILSTASPVRSAVAEDVIEAASVLVESLLHDVPPKKLIGIGVGTPGLVDSRRGVIQMAPDLGWRDVAVGGRLSERFKVPIAVVNRAKAAAVGEAWSGAGENVDNLVYVSISTGIAAGIVIDQHLYRGVSMSEGELGHVTVIPDGPLCACGNRGCLQTVAAGPAILARVRERMRFARPGTNGAASAASIDLLTLDAIAEAAALGDSLVLDVVDDVAQYVGIALANLVNTLNPRMLILGGAVIRALPLLVPRIEAVVRRRSMSVPSGAVGVVASKLGRDAVPIGAAAFLLGQVSVVASPGIGDRGRSAHPLASHG